MVSQHPKLFLTCWPATVQRNKCEFMANGLKCTVMCRLQNCENQAYHADEEESTNESDEDELEKD